MIQTPGPVGARPDDPFGAASRGVYSGAVLVTAVRGVVLCGVLTSAVVAQASQDSAAPARMNRAASGET